MTNTHAINLIQRISLSQHDDEKKEALEMAVRALQTDGDLVSRQQAIDGIESFRPIKPTRGETSMEAVNRSAWDCAINCVESFIRTMPPSAQPERKKGRWIDSQGKEKYVGYCAECSVCGEWSEYITDFCPWCGADMRGESE